jgi:hypothetical protein
MTESPENMKKLMLGHSPDEKNQSFQVLSNKKEMIIDQDNSGLFLPQKQIEFNMNLIPK